MNQSQDDQKKEQAQKKRNRIIFLMSSFFALVVVGFIGFYILNKIKTQKMTDAPTQDQFEGAVEISSQQQAECQNSAVRLSKMQDLAALEQEYKQYAENCKDVYFAIDGATPFRKEGMYADLVVDIAKEISKTDKAKAVELLKFAREIKSWDFYLGPVSCDSQHVLDAYIESYTLSEEKACFKPEDVKTKISTTLAAKDFSILSKMVPENQVVWLGMPESDVGCPEKISSVIQILKKLTPGSITVDSSQANPNENDQFNMSIKLSDTENITLILDNVQDCLRLSSVLVPNLEASE